MKIIKNQRNSPERDELLFDPSPCSGSQLRQIGHSVQCDVYIWVWLLFVEIGMGIFVLFIYFINENCGAPFSS
jgi:hypothetical protein